MVNGVQLLWAKRHGADAVLLIAALYEADELQQLANQARSLGLVPLIETHSAADVTKLRVQDGVPWELVGVNNRDLKRFKTDLAVSEQLIPQIPDGIIKISESGIFTGEDARRAKDCGADAILVGEALMRSDDVEGLVSAFQEC